MTRPHASRLALAAGLAALGACQAPDELPPVQVEGDIITYASFSPPCPGTVAEIETWLRAVAARIQIDEAELAPIHYYVVGREEIERRCDTTEATNVARACALVEDDVVAIYSPAIFDKHELIHAIHLSVWDRRPSILEEGLATVFDGGFSQAFRLADFADELDVLIEIEYPTDASNVYIAGMALSYWVYQRHGAETLTELWNQSSRGMSASAFRAVFEQVTGESIEALIAEVGSEPACQLSTCYGEVTPWDGAVWRMQVPATCDGDVIGTSESYLASRHELVEISEADWYEFGSETADVILSACGDCPILGGTGFTAVYSPAGLPLPGKARLEPGVYRIEAIWPQDGAVGGEIWLQPAP